MKTFGIFITTLFIALSTFSGMAQCSANLSFDESDLKFDTLDVYTQPFFDNCRFTSHVGAPRMPFVVKQYILPLNAEITGINFSDTTHHTISGSYLVFPAQIPAILDGREAPPFTPPDSSYYLSSARYPGNLIEINAVTNYLGYNMVILYVYPLQYLPSDLELMLFTSISFSIEYQFTGSDSLIKKMSTRQYDEIVYDLAQTIDNPDSIQSCGPVCELLVSPPDGTRPLNLFFLPGAEGDIVEYLIITNDELKNSFEVLAEWKTRKAVPALVVTTSQINDYYPGCDLAEKIFNYLKDVKNNWGPVYVLLGGDTGIIPARYATNEGGYMRATDLYYADVFKEDDDSYNWNENGNCFFWDEDDNLDLVPDIFLGRAPVNTIEEANSFVDRVLMYEQNKFSTGTKKITLIGANLKHCWDGESDPGDAAGMKIWMNPVYNNFIPSIYQMSTIRIYDKDLFDYNETYNLNKDTVLMAFEGEGENYTSGVQHIFAHIDHSGFSSIGTSQICNNSRITYPDIDYIEMDEGEIPKIMYSGGCEPNMFDKDCIAEHFMNGAGFENYHGIGIGFIGNSGFGYSTANAQCENFFEALYISPLRKLGKIFNKSQMAMDETSNPYRRNLNFLGDPELPVWTNTLNDLAIDLNLETLTTGENHLEVTVTGLSNPYTEKAFVCIQKEDEVYGAMETQRYGITHKAIFENCTPDTEGLMSVVATSPNHLYAEASIDVEENPGVHLYVNDFNPSGLYLQRGENSFKIELKNSGRIDATGVSATLNADSPYIENITIDPISFQNIEPCSSQQSTNEYEMTISLNAPDLVFIPFVLSIQSNEGEYTDKFFLQVRSSQLEYRGNKITSTSNGDIFADVNEEVKFYVALLNIGSEIAEISSATLSCDPPIPENPYFAEITLQNVSFPGIDPHSTARSIEEFAVNMNSSFPFGTQHFPLILTIIDNDSKQYVFDIKINNRTIPDNLDFISDDSSITLTWDPVSGSSGYNIYRLDPDELPPGGDIEDSTLYERLNLFVNQFSVYSDLNVEPAKDYYYKIACYTEGLPQGPYTPAFKAWTQVPSIEPWPLFIPDYGTKSEGSPILSNAVQKIDELDHPQMEIFIPMDDGTDISNSTKSSLYAFYSNGEELYNIDQNVTTYAGFANFNNTGIKATPAVGNISNDGDDYDEIAFATTMGQGDQIKSVFFYSVGDADQNELPDAIYPENGIQLNQPVKDVVVAAPLAPGSTDIKLVLAEYLHSKLDVRNTNAQGQSCPGWPRTVIDENYGGNNGVPVVADIDLNNHNEIIIGFREDDGLYVLDYLGNTIGGGPFYIPSVNQGETAVGIDCRPVIAELDNIDTNPELVLLFAFQDDQENCRGRIFALNHDGSYASYWGYDQHEIALSENAASQYAYPALSAADLDNDGAVEILVADAGKVYAWKSTGEPFNDHFPVYLEGLTCPFISPLVGNVDSDPEQEIVIASNAEEDFIYALNLDGSLVPGWPLVIDGLHSTPAIGDIDHDGLNEVVAAYGGYVNVWKTTGEAGRDQWPLYRQNSFNNAVYQDPLCEYDPDEPEVVSSNQIWADYRISDRDIIVNPGCTLTITGRLTMPDESKIVVMRGARLNLVGGIITSACSGLWEGIQVWGYRDKSQIDPNFPPGIVYLSNECLIENARTAIATIKSENGENDDNFTGGIVRCEDATFLNNIYGIRFYSYRNFNPYHPEKEMENVGYIKNCTFETNGLLSEFGAYPFAFIRMDDVVGIRLNGNYFINSSEDEYPWDMRGVGIESHNAAYNLDGYCINQIIPCDEYKRNFFSNLYCGIRADAEGRENRSITVVYSDFYMNSKGIFVSDINNFHLIFNELTIPARLSGGDEDHYGLYLDNCTGYTIEENVFIGDDNGDFNGNFGMYISNSGPEPNMIYKNDFTHLQYGIAAYGRNRAETGEGLCLKCNNFELCMNDVHVVPEQDFQGHWITGTEQGIAEDQGQPGSDTSPAGNGFTDWEENPEVFNYFISEYCNVIDYFYHEQYPPDLKIVPDPYSVEMVYKYVAPQTDYEDENHACPSNFGGAGIDLGIEKSILSSEDSLVALYSDSIQMLKDGGDTYSLNLDVYTSYPGEGEQVRQQLLSESPYLSDTVMKSAIYKENVLPNVMIRDVLVANPQSAKSTEIIYRLNEREDPMPEEMMGEIMAGRNIEGALEVLEGNLAFHRTVKYESLFKLEYYYKSDTLDLQRWLDSLINLWVEESSPEILYKLAFLYLYNSDSINCFGTLNMVPQLNDLSGQQVLDYNDYTNLFEILWQINKDTQSMDSTIVVELESLAARSSKPGSLARNVLVANDIINYNEPLVVSDNLKCQLVIPTKGTISYINKNKLSVFPNPADDYTIVSYNLEDKEGEYLITLISAEGMTLYLKNLHGIKNQFVLNTSRFPSGVYGIHLSKNGESITTAKFVISH